MEGIRHGMNAAKMVFEGALNGGETKDRERHADHTQMSPLVYDRLIP